MKKTIVKKTTSEKKTTVKKTIFEKMGSSLPYFYTKSLEKLLYYTQIKSNAKTVAGKVFFSSLLTAIIVAAVTILLESPVLIIVAASLLTFFAINLFAFSILMKIAGNRAKELERNFPDALSLIAANLRAGMTVEKAILSAAKAEFGVLEDEMHQIG